MELRGEGQRGKGLGRVGVCGCVHPFRLGGRSCRLRGNSAALFVEIKAEELEGK